MPPPVPPRSRWSGLAPSTDPAIADLHYGGANARMRPRQPWETRTEDVATPPPAPIAPSPYDQTVDRLRQFGSALASYPALAVPLRAAGGIASLVDSLYRGNATQEGWGVAGMPTSKGDLDTVVSLFDGMGGLRQALANRGIGVGRYYASEIDPAAIAVHQRNFPGTTQIGDVTTADLSQIPRRPDLLGGGSPCTDLTVMKGGRQGLEGPESKLFYDFLRARDRLDPKQWMVENVASMRPEMRDRISKELGREPIMIDAAQVSAARRPRYYWTSWDTTQPIAAPQDARQLLHATPPPGSELSPRALASITKPIDAKGTTWFTKHGAGDLTKKSQLNTVTANYKRGNPYAIVKMPDGRYRYVTPEEVEQVMGFPQGYSEGVAKTRRYEMLGNGFSLPVIEHLLSQMPR